MCFDEIENVNIMPSYKKFLKSEAFEIAYLVNKRKSSPESLNRELKNISFTFTPQEALSVDHYEKQHIKKLEKLNEILTEKLQHRKKAISSPSISRSSRTSGRSSKRNSKESQTEVVDCQKLLEFSFGEKEANAEQEINYFKFPNSFNEQNQKRRSSVHIFFDDIKKKLGPIHVTLGLQS